MALLVAKFGSVGPALYVTTEGIEFRIAVAQRRAAQIKRNLQ